MALHCLATGAIFLVMQSYSPLHIRPSPEHKLTTHGAVIPTQLAAIPPSALAEHVRCTRLLATQSDEAAPITWIRFKGRRFRKWRIKRSQEQTEPQRIRADDRQAKISDQYD